MRRHILSSERRTRGRTVIFFVAIVALFLGTFFVLQGWYRHAITVPVDSSDTSRYEIEVEKGMSASAIGEKLHTDGFIRSLLAFRILVGSEGLESQFPAGRFVVRKDQSTEEIVATLTDPAAGEAWITILEGWRAEEIAEYMARGGYMTKDEFMECIRTCTYDYPLLASRPEGQSLEGYLFPDTYIISRSTSPRDVIGKMIETMEERITPGMRSAIEQGERSVHEVLTMASIVEREVRTDSDRPVVAGILWKRLDAGIGLGADATVLYALGDWRTLLTKQNLQIDSPYNTRKFADLPPGPIASPGLAAIQAAVNPEETPYWYYLTTLDTGEVKYAETLEGHNVNKAKYL